MSKNPSDYQSKRVLRHQISDNNPIVVGVFGA